jgi:diadenosine tetraphosphate (Ap4A) HIT family hydrolase
MSSSSSNPTMQAFGHPETVLAEYRHWVVLLRPQQATLGALVLVARGTATRFSDLDPAAFAEMHAAIEDIEKTLSAQFAYEKINYLMLMMVDPNVHFHVLPRYAETQVFEGAAFMDPGWPRAPDLGHAARIDDAVRATLIDRLRVVWPKR